jgi:hypothetical protein
MLESALHGLNRSGALLIRGFRGEDTGDAAHGRIWIKKSDGNCAR